MESEINSKVKNLKLTIPSTPEQYSGRSHEPFASRQNVPCFLNCRKNKIMKIKIHLTRGESAYPGYSVRYT